MFLTELCLYIPIQSENSRSLRSRKQFRLNEQGVTDGTKSSFINDSKRIWKSAPKTITSCESLYSATIHMRDYVKALQL